MARESTPLLLSLQPRMPCIERAAWLVEDAMMGLPPRERSSQSAATREKFLFSEALRRRVLPVALMGLTLLSFFEVPLWCLPEGWAQQPFRSLSAADTCVAPGRSQRYLSGTKADRAFLVVAKAGRHWLQMSVKRLPVSI